MPIERTFSIIKPDATARNLTGAINAMIEGAGLRIVAQKRVRITREQAETFYGVHRQRPFFPRKNSVKQFEHFFAGVSNRTKRFRAGLPAPGVFLCRRAG